MPRKGTKRKRVATGGKMVRRPRQKKIPRSLKGYARIEGMYGRMNEIKFFDTGITFQPNATDASMVYSANNLLGIAQGTTQSTRIGRKIVITEIDFKAVLDGVAVNPYNYFMFSIVLDMQANGANPAFLDIYDAGGAGILPTNLGSSNVMRNMANTQRFKVLKQWRGVMNASASNGAVGLERVKSIKWFKKCRIPVEYSSTTGALTEIKSNNLVLVGCAWPQNECIITGRMRIKYSDN